MSAEMTIILSNLNRVSIFFSARFPGIFAVKSLFKIPVCLAHFLRLLAVHCPGPPGTQSA